MGETHAISRKKSFQIAIESNGSKHTGSEQEVPGDNEFPTHFESIFTFRPSTPPYPHYDLHIKADLLRINVITMTHAPTMPSGKDDQIMWGDTVIVNDVPHLFYRVIGLHTEPSSPVDYVIYVIQEKVSHATMTMYTPKVWSVEANRERVQETRFYSPS
jgi:hypothetical protein